MVVLGCTVEGQDLCARLASPQVAHILISGTTGCGKTVLLKTIAAGLVAGAMPAQLQLLAIDPKGRHFKALDGVAHLIRPVIQDVEQAIEALYSVAHLMEKRDAAHESEPALVVLIDELADLVMQGGEPLTAVLSRLVSRGREAGIHIIAATQHPASAILTGVVKANFPLRICGKVADADAARMALGRAGSNAHLLRGKGDFYAISGAELVRFQAAFCDDKMLREIVAPFTGTVDSTLHRLNLNVGLVPAGLFEQQHAPATPPTPRAALPELEGRDWVQEAVDALRPQWSELRAEWLAQEWGVKSKLCRLVWGRRSEGAFTGWLEEAVEILENEIATATATDKNAPIATAGAVEDEVATSRSRSRNHSARARMRHYRRYDA
jgi:hypothetical protein